MKVLVTGSEGSLMQAVIPKLIDQGHEVVGVDNLVRYGERLGHAGENYTFVRGDLTDRDFVNVLMREHKPDYVIQAAARIYGIGGFNKYCADILGEDITLHNNILKSAVNNGVERVVYVSSSMVYEKCIQDTNFPVSEDMPFENIAPVTDYGLSKFTGEKLSMAFSKQYSMDYTIWRPFNIITPYERSEGEIGTSHVFADYIKNIVVNKMTTLPIIGDGLQVRCFTWIDDVASAIANSSFDEMTRNEIFNLANPEPVTMKHLANVIHQEAMEMGLIQPSNLDFKTVRKYNDDVLVRVPDTSKADLYFGWAAKRSLRESVRECLKGIANEL
jgi:nucleoside-diphosphate-sugar epimerase